MARAKMSEQTIEAMTAESIEDPAAALRQRRADLTERRGVAVAARDAMRPGGTSGPLPLRIAYLRVLEDIERLDAELGAVSREQEGRRVAAVEQAIAQRKPARVLLLRELAQHVEAAIDAAKAVRDYDAATGAAVSRAPGVIPCSALLGIVADQLAALRREITGPGPAPRPAPVAQGQRRLRLTAPVWDREGPRHLRVGDVADFDEAPATDLLKRKIGVEVA
ncbi:MAG: hypothetical protein HY725_11790 [Candidatus Rokubacteria bacterium]|nr:hypothetical protein [Candidatus Rokubacteria bacterium]